jgi:beta-xylosidase
MLGAAYVRGLQSAGSSPPSSTSRLLGLRGARNLAPVSMGPRELADVILPPFEMALRGAGPAR